MSSEGSVEKDENIEVIYEIVDEEISEDTPTSEWSSLHSDLPEENKLHDIGLCGNGEICAKYVSMSTSTVLGHPFYNYPAVANPGIEEALLQSEDDIVYPSDGQDLYLALCNEMNQCPVKIFYKGLLNETINLKYYSIHKYGVRPMAIALKDNINVTVLNLTDNFLNEDSCFHLGEMLKSNLVLRELILPGCKIGAIGARKLFAGLLLNNTLCVLNLNRNELGDIGMKYLAEIVFQGINVQQMLVSYNNIGDKSATVLAEAFEIHNTFTHLDLSWNNMSNSDGTQNLLTRLAENTFLVELNLSWNNLSGPRIAARIKTLLRSPNLRAIDLSHNKLNGEAISTIIGSLVFPDKLLKLNLSYNPLTPEDTIQLLHKIESVNVKMLIFLLENVFVNEEFLGILQAVKTLKSKENSAITYGTEIDGYKTSGADMRELVLNRADFLGRRHKKRPVDIAIVAMQLLKDGVEIMPSKAFAKVITNTGARLDASLVDEIVNTFPAHSTSKDKAINIAKLVEYMHRKWPDRKLPPSPPPETEPEPEQVLDLQLKPKHKPVTTKSKIRV